MPVLKLTVAREALGISRAEAARRACVNASTLSQLELGRFKGYPGQMTRLAEVVGHMGDPYELLEPAGER
jgi:transcriptional regulator with XRE-family HTH domain